MVLSTCTGSGENLATLLAGFCHGRQTRSQFRRSITAVLPSGLRSQIAPMISVLLSHVCICIFSLFFVYRFLVEFNALMLMIWHLKVQLTCRTCCIDLQRVSCEDPFTLTAENRLSKQNSAVCLWSVVVETLGVKR